MGAVLAMAYLNADLVQEIFRNANFIHTLGIRLLGFGPGWCETDAVISRALHQQHGLVHAGVLMTIADHACGGAAATTVPEEKDVITVENKIVFLRPATGQTIFCRAEVLRSGKNLVFAEAVVSGDDHGTRRMVAKGSSTLLVIPRKKDSAAS